jgi:hypothetical protein
MSGIRTVDDFEPDKENIEFNSAIKSVKEGVKLVYLTGKAGTGKTTFLKYIKKTINKNIVILAPTGVAALNAGGSTISSFFQIPFSPFTPNDSRLRTTSTGTKNKETIYTTFRYGENKRQIINNLELIIIDEISMVRADTLDVIDRILKIYRNNIHFPFGGVQVLLIGDVFQLPPIAKKDEWNILSQFYKSKFFFNSKIIEQNMLIIFELKKIYRQKEEDFIGLLNRVRIGEVTIEDLNKVNSIPTYSPTFSNNENNYITLATHKNTVNEVNLTKLNEIETESHLFKAIVTGEFPNKDMPTNDYLELKVGSQIMFVKNDRGELKNYINGTIAKIKKLTKDEIVVDLKGKHLLIKKEKWENNEYTYNKETKRVEEKIVGTFEQFPLQLAWAITVNKSQGLTFDKVIVDLSNAFAPGQVYVALSRCRSFSGLKLKTQLNNNAIRTDPRVIEFAKNETPKTLIVEQLKTARADFYYKKSREELTKGKIISAFNLFKKALNFRNDIDTDLFKKFIVIQGNKFLSFKKKSLDANYKVSDLTEEISVLNIEQDNLSQKIKKLNKNIEFLTKNNLSKENNIEDKKHLIASLISEIDTFETDYINSKKENQKIIKGLNDLKRENKTLKQVIDVLTKKGVSKEVEIKEKETLIESLSNEIDIFEINSIESKKEKKKIIENINVLTKDNLFKSKLIKHLQSKTEIHVKEINRLTDLKWYHKIIGRK